MNPGAKVGTLARPETSATSDVIATAHIDTGHDIPVTRANAVIKLFSNSHFNHCLVETGEDESVFLLEESDVLQGLAERGVPIVRANEPDLETVDLYTGYKARYYGEAEHPRLVITD
jgi:hypothetical protein